MIKNRDEFRFNSRPFQSIEDTVKTTGLSAYYLRRGIHDGTVPHIKSGTKYLVNVVRLLESLDALPVDRG